MEKEYINQESIISWITENLGSELMIPVSGKRVANGFDVCIQNYLLQESEIEREMLNDTYNAHSLFPCVNTCGNWEDGDYAYLRYGNYDEFEPLVINREFYGVAPDSTEIAEEFRLLFNLFYDETKKEYIDPADGACIIVVKMDDEGFVTIHKRYLKTYLTLKEKVLLIHVDSRCTDLDNSTRFEYSQNAVKADDNSYLYSLTLGQTDGLTRRENFSMVYAKKVVYGCSLASCNIWPFNEAKNFINFIVGVDDDGNEISFTCNPDKLSSYFGTNPNAPHYLTSVFFSPAVLEKYLAKPELYTVTDTMLSCGNLWALYIDRNDAGYVSAYLGDLGRDLPSKAEQHYWRGFNIITDSNISSARFKRDFMCIAASSDSEDSVFKRNYVRVNTLVEEKLGWPLFLQLENQDKYNFDGLRIPIHNAIPEFDMLVLSLVKSLIDSLNEKNIVRVLTGNCTELKGSIARIEIWFKEKNVPNYEEHIKFLRNLQELRSCGTGHRKGKGYKKITAALGISENNYVESFKQLLEKASAFLCFVENNIELLAK